MIDREYTAQEWSEWIRGTVANLYALDDEEMDVTDAEIRARVMNCLLKMKRIREINREIESCNNKFSDLKAQRFELLVNI